MNADKKPNLGNTPRFGFLFGDTEHKRLEPFMEKKRADAHRLARHRLSLGRHSVIYFDLVVTENREMEKGGRCSGRSAARPCIFT